LKSHLSHYAEKDLEVADSCRTKPIRGNLNSQRKGDGLSEIDASKAHTASFCDITEIQIFNEFDRFKPCTNEEILPLSRYAVKDFNHRLCTQSHILVYGKYVRSDMHIVAFKQPSFIKQVNYKKLVGELYETKISDNEQ
jgi:hypothetical protein